MTRSSIWSKGGAVALAVGFLAPVAAFARAGFQGSTEDAAERDACRQAATPGEHHAHLAALAGDWDVAAKWWKDPDGAPELSAGASRLEPILGGRFVRQDFQGTVIPAKATEGRLSYGRLDQVPVMGRVVVVSRQK